MCLLSWGSQISRKGSNENYKNDHIKMGNKVENAYYLLHLHRYCQHETSLYHICFLRDNYNIQNSEILFLLEDVFGVHFKNKTETTFFGEGFCSAGTAFCHLLGGLPPHSLCRASVLCLVLEKASVSASSSFDTWEGYYLKR